MYLVQVTPWQALVAKMHDKLLHRQLMFIHAYAGPCFQLGLLSALHLKLTSHNVDCTCERSPCFLSHFCTERRELAAHARHTAHASNLHTPDISAAENWLPAAFLSSEQPLGWLLRLHCMIALFRCDGAPLCGPENCCHCQYNGKACIRCNQRLKVYLDR